MLGLKKYFQPVFCRAELPAPLNMFNVILCERPLTDSTRYSVESMLRVRLMRAAGEPCG